MLDNIEFIFIHIEKSMGTSFRFMLLNYLKDIYKKDEIYLPSNNKHINLTNIEHYFKINKLTNDYKVLLCHISYKSKFLNNLFNNSYIITCVRNPFKRLLSHYYFFEKKNFCNKKFYELDDNEIIYFLSGKIGNLTTFRLVSEKIDEIIDIKEIEREIDKINCIVIYEKIEDDLKMLNNILNEKYNKNSKIKMENRNSNKENYKENYDLDINVLNKYTKYFMNDIEVYNYILSLSLEKRFKL